MKIHNMTQGSEEWLKIRELKLTASHAQEIANIGKGLDTYTNNIVCESFAITKDEGYTNTDMARGNDLEEEARVIYEMETGNKVKQVGFIEFSEYVGCSPDGLISEDGGIEIKSLNNKVYTELVLTGKISSKYIWQIQMNLFITGRKWWDFVAYNPNYYKSLWIQRVEPDSKKFERIQEGITKGTKILLEKYDKCKKFMEN